MFFDTFLNFRLISKQKSEKQEIVNLHNKLRSKIAKGLETRGADGKAQPSAANMKKVSWDDELSTVAQVYIIYKITKNIYRYSINRTICTIAINLK